MIGRIAPILPKGVDIGSLHLKFVAEKHVIDGSPAFPAAETVISGADGRGTGGFIQADEMKSGVAVPVFCQDPDGLAMRSGIQIAHQEGRQSFPLVEPVHGFQDQPDAQGARGGTNMVKVCVEYPDFAAPGVDINFTDGADAWKYRVIGAAPLLIRMFGQPEGAHRFRPGTVPADQYGRLLIGQFFGSAHP